MSSEAIIQITTGGQGSPVVSARELYDFLGLAKATFARWSKKNIENNPFAVEGSDWEGFNIMLKGNEAKDYALTLDFAKRLSMLARTEKGEQARQYFLDCEKRAKESQAAPALTASTTEQAILQLMQGQQALLQQLRADVDQILAGKNKRPPGQQLALPFGGPADTAFSRKSIFRLIAEYGAFWDREPGEIYGYLYKRMAEVYAIHVHRLHRKPGEPIIEALERYGHLEKLYSLIQAELNYSEK